MKIEDLTEKDIGRWVEYNSGYEKEKGKIKSFNDKWIFVVYHCENKWNNITAATNPKDLEFI